LKNKSCNDCRIKTVFKFIFFVDDLISNTVNITKLLFLAMNLFACIIAYYREVVLCVKFVVDEKLKTGELERELLVTYDVAAIKEIVPKLASKVGNNQAVFLTDKVQPSHIFADFTFCMKRDHPRSLCC